MERNGETEEWWNREIMELRNGEMEKWREMAKWREMMDKGNGMVEWGNG